MPSFIASTALAAMQTEYRLVPQKRADEKRHAVLQMKCNRIRFHGGFHIEVSVHHPDEPKDDRKLTSEDGWVDSDPNSTYIKLRDKFTDADQAVVRRLIPPRSSGSATTQVPGHIS
jgi:hypothetical protein